MAHTAKNAQKWRTAFLRNPLIKKRTGILIVLAILAIIALSVKNYISYDSKTTKLGFEDIGELATQSVYCTEVDKMDPSRKLFGFTIPFTQSTYIYSYDVVIKAGFDFADVKWIPDDNAKTISVTLPEIRTLSNEIDLDSFKVYLEDESAFRQITLEENNNALKTMQENAEADAIANGLYENARSNAEALLRGFFSSAYDLDVYQIKFT